MIHLDTNLLIAATDPADLHVPVYIAVLDKGLPMGASACAWTEYHSRPVDPQTEKLLLQMLRGGIVPFDEETAILAGELFFQTGSKRRTRMDCMIAATAIRAGAELATTDPEDFAAFVPYGLKLHPTSHALNVPSAPDA